jgi:tetratricopeptide (TPR) repeat protein
MQMSPVLSRRITRLTKAFFISFCLAFPLYSCDGGSISAQKGKAIVQTTENQGKSKHRLIVLPLRQEDEQAYTGTGLAIHFLLGNVVALHTDLKEFWFGWRVKKIFLEKERLRAYCHGEDPQLDFSKLGKEQGIRYWLRGSVQQRGSTMKATLILTDTKGKNKERSTTLTLDVSNQLIGFRKGFLAWMEKCGLPLPDAQAKKTLWPEKSNPEGLDLLGRALETYYLHSSWGEKGPLCLYLFDRAVSTAPASYLAHDIKGWALYKNKDYRAAKESFRSALTLNPHGLAALAGLMWCAIYTHDEDAAYTWAVAKADLRGESRKAAKAHVKKRIRKAARKTKGEPGL